jgi:hypothetical protein
MEGKIKQIAYDYTSCTEDRKKLETKLLNLFSYSLSKYKDGANAGQIAKECGVTVGEIGCHNCGCTVHGAITEDRCASCGQHYFDFN